MPDFLVLSLASSLKISILCSCNGSPAGYFAIALCEPRQDRKVATVVELRCAEALLVGLPPFYNKKTMQPSFVSSITLYFKITRSIFYVVIIFLSILTTLLLIQFASLNIQIFTVVLCAVICCSSFLYVIRLWHYRIELNANSLTIHGVKTTIIALAQIEKINERTVNGFMHINLYLKGQHGPQYKLYEYLDHYDELRAFLFEHYPYSPH